MLAVLESQKIRKKRVWNSSKCDFIQGISRGPLIGSFWKTRYNRKLKIVNPPQLLGINPPKFCSDL